MPSYIFETKILLISIHLCSFLGRDFAYCTILFLFYPITLEGRRGTTDEFATIPFHLDLFSAALVELAKSTVPLQADHYSRDQNSIAIINTEDSV